MMHRRRFFGGRHLVFYKWIGNKVTEQIIHSITLFAANFKFLENE